MTARVTLRLTPHLARVMAAKLVQYADAVDSTPAHYRKAACFYPANLSPYPLTVRIERNMGSPARTFKGRNLNRN